MGILKVAKEKATPRYRLKVMVRNPPDKTRLCFGSIGEEYVAEYFRQRIVLPRRLDFTWLMFFTFTANASHIATSCFPVKMWVALHDVGECGVEVALFGALQGKHFVCNYVVDVVQSNLL